MAAAAARREAARRMKVVDCPVKIRPLKILSDPKNEALMFASSKNSRCELMGMLDWPGDVFHRCHSEVCSRDPARDPDHFNPFCWSATRVEDCQVKALEMAGGISMFVIGTVYHPALGVLHSASRAMLALKAGYTFTELHTGMIVFSAPLKCLEYDALQWLDDQPRTIDYEPFNMEAQIAIKRFMAGAQAKQVSRTQAALEYAEAVERGIRPSIILHRFSQCLGDICWFPPSEVLTQVFEFAKQKMELSELLHQLELPEVFIEETCSQGASYTIEQACRALWIKVIPADGLVYYPNAMPSVTLELARQKLDALIPLEGENLAETCLLPRKKPLEPESKNHTDDAIGHPKRSENHTNDDAIERPQTCSVANAQHDPQLPCSNQQD